MTKPRGRRPSVPLSIRFRKFFVEGAPDECWLWMGSRNLGLSNSHGRLKGEGGKSNVLAHRVAYELHHGLTVPPDVQVLHTCDVPHCVNPAHLFLGTQPDNVADMHMKGRANISHPGTKNPRAVLTEEQVREIRRLVAGGAGIRPLARIYGVTPPVIRYIRDGKTWANLV